MPVISITKKKKKKKDKELHYKQTILKQFVGILAIIEIKHWPKLNYDNWSEYNV